MREMKDSGVDWIGDIPAHWEVKRIKDVCNVVCGATPKDRASYWDGDIIWISPSDMSELGEIKEGARTITEQGYQSCGTSLVPEGSIVMSTRAPIGKINIATNELCTNQGCKCLTSTKLNMKFMLYYMWSKNKQFQALGRGTTFIELSTKDLSLFLFAIPPIEEQQAIADYLDKKTAEIDEQISLFEQKQNAYTKLKQSLISQVVTRGLNPNAPLKNSGIDWIGEIPAHWEVRRFKAFAKTIKGKSYDTLNEPFDGSYKVLSVECLRQDEAQFYDYVFVDDENQICTSNDIVVIWDGAGVGEFLKAKDGVLSSTIAKIQLTNKSVILPYLWYWRYKVEYRLKSIPTGMGIPHLNPTLLNNFKIAIPPIEEQQAIADYLDKKTAEIDEQISNIDKKINTYKRLKQSLIDEVVTGKRKI